VTLAEVCSSKAGGGGDAGVRWAWSRRGWGPSRPHNLGSWLGFERMPPALRFQTHGLGSISVARRGNGRGPDSSLIWIRYLSGFMCTAVVSMHILRTANQSPSHPVTQCCTSIFNNQLNNQSSFGSHEIWETSQRLTPRSLEDVPIVAVLYNSLPFAGSHLAHPPPCSCLHAES